MQPRSAAALTSPAASAWRCRARRHASAVSLVQEADIAMYRAKRAGRRQAMLFDDSMRVEAVDRLEFDRELRDALDHDEFELYFQPIIYFDARPTIQSFEALIRWNHPRHGVLDPADFLPMVEQVGLMNTVGQWVFTSACRAVAAMRLDRSRSHASASTSIPSSCASRASSTASLAAIAAARITGEALVDRDHRARGDERRRRRSATCSRSCRRSASRSRSTTSAPATPTSACCAACRSTSSRSIALRRRPRGRARRHAGRADDPRPVDELGIKAIAEGVETTAAGRRARAARLRDRAGLPVLTRRCQFDDVIADAARISRPIRRRGSGSCRSCKRAVSDAM